MGLEQHSESNGLIPELSPLHWFDSLIDRMSQHIGDAEGPFGLPETRVWLDGKELPVQFFVFNPRPLEEYETSSYQPSIIMEKGVGFFEADTGRVISVPERYWVRRSMLDSPDPYDETALEALLNLSKIEKVFGEYVKAIDASGPSE